MKIQKGEVIFTAVLFLIGGFTLGIGILGIILQKEASTCALFILTGICVLCMAIVNLLYTTFYKEIYEIPCYEFQTYEFRNMYIIAHKKSGHAFEIPISIVNMLDLNNIRMTKHFNWLKKFKKETFELNDQKLKN